MWALKYVSSPPCLKSLFSDTTNGWKWLVGSLPQCLEITRTLVDQTEQYVQAFVMVLLENLSSEVPNRNAKISILACFDDMTLAIGPRFEPYSETAMTVLRQAADWQANSVRAGYHFPRMCNR